MNAVAFAPNSRSLASGSYDQTVRIWDVETGSERHRLCEHAGFVWTVAFSPDGRLLASAGGDAAVRVWEAESGQERFSLAGHAGVVWAVAFSPDGTRLASAGWDKTVRLWDTNSGREMVSLRAHADAVNTVAFSPDGTKLVASSFYTSVVLALENLGLVRRLGGVMERGDLRRRSDDGPSCSKVSVIGALSLSPVTRRPGLYFTTDPKEFFNAERVVRFLRDLLRHLRGKVGERSVYNLIRDRRHQWRFWRFSPAAAKSGKRLKGLQMSRQG